MKKGHVLDELSAYIDGEARDPERIERHLRQCPACARRHLELLRLSSHLGALREPEVSPAFLTRVMAHAREAEPLPARRAWWAAAPRWGMAIALIVAGLGLLYGNLPGGGTLPGGRTAPGPETPGAVAGLPEASADYLDDEAVVEALAALMDQGADLSYVAADTPRSWLMEDSTVTYDDVVALLAEEVEAEDGSFVTVMPDNVYGAIDSLEDTEAEAFESLLTDYMGKG